MRALPLHQTRPHAVTHVTARARAYAPWLQMNNQAAEAKPETEDIKAEAEKPKVPAPQWAWVGEPFRENLETSDPGLF